MGQKEDLAIQNAVANLGVQEAQQLDLQRLHTLVTAAILGPLLAVEYKIAVDKAGDGPDLSVNMRRPQAIAIKASVNVLQNIGYPITLQNAGGQ